ncbi:exodeoxyribonuclease VII large subunit [Brevibacillus massiliensis]|jgi:exodeoxyribonuclease VII large subunit|uniref:exodeoxyribonuclease VII large subunit n=1 Tax=Brevibacillus massiliensis TaxID=1118054 RepID=UPI0003060F9B|nr:exodeoxyribonuclease VII large subunit [Brevibacillus massiliensis]
MKTVAIWSVTDLNRFIKGQLEKNSQLADVWVRGEISNFTHHTSGHMYFTLKDKDSRVKVVMFSSYNRFLKFIPKNGTKAIVRGSISVFERDGAYQLYAREMQPDGIGSLYLAFEQLKEKLQAEGLFAAERKRPLPKFPKRVGVVTSPTGAAVRDILITIKRRFPQAGILLVPAVVQGKEAPMSIVAAISRINQYGDVDVLIVGRGGGSIEELWAFNDEHVARSIAGSRIPVISAVGHETDFTIADFVADVRAATPTAAAELAVPHYLEWMERIKQLENRLHRAIHGRLTQERARLEQLSQSYGLRQPERRVAEQQQRLDEAVYRLGLGMRQALRKHRERQEQLAQRLKRFRLADRIKVHRQQLHRMQAQLQQRMGYRVERARAEWTGLLAQLDALSPLKVMQRGYALVYRESQLAKSVRDIAPGDKLMVRLSDGTIRAEVLETNREGIQHDPEKG